MKRKAKTLVLAACLAVAMILCSALGSAFMREPSEASAEEIVTYGSSEDVTETVQSVLGGSLEGATFVTDEGVLFEYGEEYGGFVITGAQGEYEGDGVSLLQPCTEAYIPDVITVTMGNKLLVGYEEYTYPVVRIEDSAFRGNTDITYIRIGKYVEYIGDHAFYNTTSVEKIEYCAINAENGAKVDSFYSGPFYYTGRKGSAEWVFGRDVEIIDEYMFYYGYASKVSFEEGGCLREIGDYAFRYFNPCSSSDVTDFMLPDTVEKVGKYALAMSMPVSNGNVPKALKEVGGKAAFGFLDIESLHFEATDMPDLTSSDQPFYGLGDDRYYENGKWESGKTNMTVYIGRDVTRIPDYCFYADYTRNTHLEKYPAGAYIKSICPEYAYEGGSDDGGYSLSYIGKYAFYNMYWCTSMEFPMGLDDVAPYAFSGSNVSKITLGDTDGWYAENDDGSSVPASDQVLFAAEFMSDPSTVATYWKTTYTSYRFRWTDGFEYELSADGTYYSVTGYTGGGGDVTIPETHRAKEVREIAASAFKSETAVTSAVIPESVEKIGASAFYGCTKLASVTVRGSGLKEVGSNAFYNCSALKSLYVSSASAFVSADYDGRYANPLALVSSNGGKFYVGGDSYTTLNINGTDRIGTYALAYCTIISDIVIGETVETIGSYAFYGDTAIKSIKLPESVKYIGESAFSSSGVAEVSFAVTGGWKIYDSSGNVYAEPSASEVSSSAAELLTGTYAKYVWKNEKTNFLAPVITGVSEDPVGFYTNGDISLFVSVAEGAYVTAVFWTAPDGVCSSVPGDALTLSSDELVCGTYVFWAEDSDGNLSDYYYAVYDDVPPEIYATGATIFDGYVGEGFTVYASDNLSSVDLWYSYRGGNWISADGDSCSVLSSSGDGRYSFYAEDRAGNRCGEYTLILDTVEPYGSWERQDFGTYALSFVWDDSSWSCEMNGEPYESGSPITTEGSWTATLTTLSGIRGSFSTDLSHNFVVESMVSGNCEEGGTAVYVCTYCGASYEAETTAAGSHTYVLEIVEPTCESEGYTVSVCEACGAYDWSTYTYISPLGHDVLETEIAATCEDDGFRGAVCLRCGKEFEGTALSATGHLWYVVAFEAGCETEGYRETVCLRCSEVSSYEVMEPLGHDYAERSRTEATCEEASLVTYRCTRCSSVYEAYEGGTAEHDYSVVSVVRESSCGAEGERRLTCSVCGDFVTEAIPALSHNNVETGRYKDSETGETFVTYACSICGESFTVSIGNQEEAAASGITGMMDTYTRYMWWILLATVAVWSVAMGVRYAMARNSDDKAKAKSMIVNYVIGIVVIAVILVACPYLVYAIALLAK